MLVDEGAGFRPARQRFDPHASATAKKIEYVQWRQLTRHRQARAEAVEQGRLDAVENRSGFQTGRGVQFATTMLSGNHSHDASISRTGVF